MLLCFFPPAWVWSGKWAPYFSYSVYQPVVILAMKCESMYIPLLFVSGVEITWNFDKDIYSNPYLYIRETSVRDS